MDNPPEDLGRLCLSCKRPLVDNFKEGNRPTIRCVTCQHIVDDMLRQCTLNILSIGFLQTVKPDWLDKSKEESDYKFSDMYEGTP